jgi:hypothetical protein
MDRKTIIQKVLIKLDEIAPFGQGLVVSATNIDTKPIEKYIDECLDESTGELLLTLPTHLLPNEKMTISNQVTITDNVAFIKLPDEFLKLGYIKFPCWNRPVKQTINESNPIYNIQKNPYTRSGYEKPIVIIKKDITLKKILECYTVLNDDTNKSGVEVVYIKKTNPDSIAENLVPSLVLLCATKVLSIIGQGNLAQLMKADYFAAIQLFITT